MPEVSSWIKLVLLLLFLMQDSRHVILWRSMSGGAMPTGRCLRISLPGSHWVAIPAVLCFIASGTSLQRRIAILSRIHPQRLDREDEFVVRVRDHATLVENPFDRLLQPLSIWLLSAHNELQPLLNRPAVRISSFEQADDCPCCHDDLGACWMFDIGHRLTRLDFR